MKKTVAFIVLVLIAIQFIPLERTNPKEDPKLVLHTDKKVMKILQKSCYDCHSNNTHWSEYAYIAPLSFGVVSHVKDGRKALNFSNYKNIPKDIKLARLKRAINMIKLETMPLGSYTLFHHDAKLSPNEKKIVIKWLRQEIDKLEKE